MLALVFWPRSEPREQRTPLKAIPLTTYEGREGFPTFSPDGSQVAFIWDEDGDDVPSIYVRSVESEQPHRVTDHAGAASYPAWSPDGSSIAYLLEGETGCELRLISPTGGASRTVTALSGPLGEFFHTRLAWSPDGRFIAYSDRQGADEPEALFAVELETRETWRLTHPPDGIYGDSAPSFAWEANELAFIRRFSMYVANEIRTLHLDKSMRPAQNSIAVPLRGPLPVRAASSVLWSEDDDELLYLLTGVLWRAPARGGEATRVLTVGDQTIHATLNRQKDRLAFTQYRQDEDIWRLDRESGETRPLVTSTWSDKYLSISPDGERIAWTSFRSGFSEIWVCNADGSEPLQLTSLESFSGSPTWSPDGKLIAFDTRVKGSGDIYVVDSSGGIPRPLLDGPYDDLEPAWSADGGALYFRSQRDGGPAIWRVRIETGETERVSKAGNAGHWAKTSPDGRYLYFGGVSSYGGDQRLYRKRLADGEETAILDGVIATAPVAGGVYYALREPASIQYMDVESGVVEQVLALERPAYHLAISPDERTILFTQSEPRQADLMLIEGIR